MTFKEQDMIRGLIQETSNAYDLFHESGSANGDYADFATLSIGDFKSALRDPGLTRRPEKEALTPEITNISDPAPPLFIRARRFFMKISKKPLILLRFMR